MLSLPLSLKEDGGEKEEGWGGRLKEGRSGGQVNERLRKTGRDKADELEVYLNCSLEGSQVRVGCHLREAEGEKGLRGNQK